MSFFQRGCGWDLTRSPPGKSRLDVNDPFEQAASVAGSPERSSAVRDDIVAGVTVAVVGLPQCLAYAMMAGLPPAYGLVTAAIPGVVAALVGRSAQVVTGPTNTTGLLILAALTPYLSESGLIRSDALSVMATLTLLAGAIRLSAALVGGEKLLRFLPESVLMGFTAGAGVLIAAMQLDEALGLAPVRGGGLLAEIDGLVEMMRAGARPSVAAALLTLGTGAAIFAGRRFARRVPVALIVTVLAAVAAYWFEFDGDSGMPLVGERAHMSSGWPQFAAPSYDISLIQSLLVPAAAIALLGTLELTVAARAGGARPDMKREVLGQGAGNTLGAFVGAFPASASLTRSILMLTSGARTRLAPAVAGVALVPALLIGGGAVGYIPQATLAGVLMVTAASMVNHRTILRMWRTAPGTRVLLFVTAAATLVLPLEWAILSGVGLGLLLHLAHMSVPRVTLLAPLEGRLVPPLEGDEPERVVLAVSGALHYAAVPAFLRKSHELLPRSARVIVIDVSHAHDMRYSALQALEDFAEEQAREGIDVRVAGVAPGFLKTLQRTGSRLPVEVYDPEPGASAWRCLEDSEVRARP